MANPVLTAADPEPAAWTIVRDDTGCQWVRQPGRVPCGWISEHDTAAVDPESWAKVAGNYGPVTVLFTPTAGAPEVKPQPRPDLAAQIREAVEEARVTLLSGIRPIEDKRANQLADVLLAVLDCHPAAPYGIVDKPVYDEHGSFKMTWPHQTFVCNTCNEAYPCREVRLIAAKLGIEVDRG